MSLRFGCPVYHVIDARSHQWRCSTCSRFDRRLCVWYPKPVRRLAFGCSVLVGLTFALAAGLAQALPFVYVTNQGGNDVSQYGVGAGGLLSPLSQATVGGVVQPIGIATAPDGRSVYVTNAATASITQYDLNPLTGALSSKTPAQVDAGAHPNSITVSPDGRSAYVANGGGVPGPSGNTIGQYDVDPLTGRLTPKDPPFVPAGGSLEAPVEVALTPDGRSAFVTTTVHALQYDVDPATGELSPKDPAVVGTPESPFYVAVAPDGRSAYFRNSHSVTQFDVDPATGELSPKTPASVLAGSGPGEIAVGVDARSLYTADGNDNTVSQYDISLATGTLSPKTPATVPTGNLPVGIALHPDGRSFYVANSNNGVPGPGNTISQYAIDPATGTLSPKTPSAVAAGFNPIDIAVTPAAGGPANKDQCKRGGWKQFGFKNQGQCIAFVLLSHG